MIKKRRPYFICTHTQSEIRNVSVKRKFRREFFFYLFKFEPGKIEEINL